MFSRGAPDPLRGRASGLRRGAGNLLLRRGPKHLALPLTISKSCPRGVKTSGASTVPGSEMRKIPKPGFRSPRSPPEGGGPSSHSRIPRCRISLLKDPFVGIKDAIKSLATL